MSPNKTLYIRDEDVPVWDRADQASKAAGASTSKIVTAALRRCLPNPKDIQVVFKSEDHVNEFDGRPQLEYGRHPSHGMGWTLNHMDAEGNFVVEDVFTSAPLEDAPSVIEWARGVVANALTDQEQEAEELDKITVEIGEPGVTVGFTGRWLVEPDSDETRSGEEGRDAGTYWGVALTKRGRIAVYTAHCNEAWPATLNDYDSLNDAESDVPADILARAAGELGEERVIWRDI